MCQSSRSRKSGSAAGSSYRPSRIPMDVEKGPTSNWRSRGSPCSSAGVCSLIGAMPGPWESESRGSMGPDSSSESESVRRIELHRAARDGAAGQGARGREKERERGAKALSSAIAAGTRTGDTGRGER
eukprot:scaffold143436_cov37-Tisochrysis_lutea.AAC.2